MKAPLRQAKGFTSLLQEELKRKENENISEYFHYISLSLRKMFSLIGALVSYAKISMINISFMEFDTQELVKGLVREIQGIDSSLELLHEIGVEQMPIIKADPNLIFEFSKGCIHLSLIKSKIRGRTRISSKNSPST